MGAGYFSKNDNNENKLVWAETPEDHGGNAYANIDKPEASAEVTIGATAKANISFQFVFNAAWICFSLADISNAGYNLDETGLINKWWANRNHGGGNDVKLTIVNEEFSPVEKGIHLQTSDKAIALLDSKDLDSKY